MVSKRYKNRNQIIKDILDFGYPVIVASDVNPPPKAIKKIARSFGCKVFYPEKSLTNFEKEKIIKKYKRRIKGFHQKDALAASLKAFKSYRELFAKIEDATSKVKNKKIFDKVVRKVLLSKSKNIAEVIRELMINEKK